MSRKLIEVALPLEAINAESAREKSIRHGHPSTLHLWWARRPLAAARAVLFAQLVDDPSAHPDQFPTEEAQQAERARLHEIIERLVVWENINDEDLYAQAHAEILKSTGGNPPPILDPFAGGGTIPLEAQRLGLEAHASDLNPVAVLINKALIEIPPKFRDQPPVFPGLADTRASWSGAEGLAADVRAYGQWMRDEAEQRIGHLYPKATLPDGSEANVIAWIWARTVICPNPACGIEMPLVRSWWLGKKKGKEAYVVPHVVVDASHPSGRRVEFSIGHDPAGPASEGTVNGRRGGVCVACGSTCSVQHIREGIASGSKPILMATVGEGLRRRVYLPPTRGQTEAALISAPDITLGSIADNPRWFSPPAYGLSAFEQLFTNRQLVALTTFSDLVGEARERVLADAKVQGLPTGERLEAGGVDAEAYADAVATYLGLVTSRMNDRQSSISSWDSSSSKEQVRGVFARQAIPMTWDFAEANPFVSSSGALSESVEWVARVADLLPATVAGVVKAVGAEQFSNGFALLSTDPPYYDNIGYSDLSDFFYVWLRRSLRAVHPSLLSTLLVPKAEELVANPYRQGGKQQAKEFFEAGFREVFANARKTALPDYPITVYYAFKQSESDAKGTASTGWETLLEGMIRSGWAITATWPVRSELSNRMIGAGTNALASSIVLALRPRSEGAPSVDRRGFISQLQAELPDALRKLQQGIIAPVDLPQAAIGPGMAVFSRYSAVWEPDGSKMTVRSALARINEILDQVLNEQEGDFDAATRFAIAWYRQHGYQVGKFGDADNVARARNTAVDALDRAGILSSRAGKVQLLAPDKLPEQYDVLADQSVSAWEITHRLIHLATTTGLDAAGQLLASAAARPTNPVDPDHVKELAFLCYSIAEKNGWTRDALGFNTLAASWGQLKDTPAPRPGATQDSLDFEEE